VSGRKLTYQVLGSLSGEFDQLYAATGRRSIAPECILRALLLQVFYSIRPEWQLVEQQKGLSGNAQQDCLHTLQDLGKPAQIPSVMLTYDVLGHGQVGGEGAPRPSSCLRFLVLKVYQRWTGLPSDATSDDLLRQIRGAWPDLVI